MMRQIRLTQRKGKARPLLRTPSGEPVRGEEGPTLFFLQAFPLWVLVAALCLALCSEATAGPVTDPNSDTLAIQQRQADGTFKDIFTGTATEGANDSDVPATIDSGVIHDISVFNGTGFTFPLDRTVKLVEGPGSTRISDLVRIQAAREPLDQTKFQFRVTLMSDTAESLGSVALTDPLRVIEGDSVNVTNQLFFGGSTLPDNAPNPPPLRILATSDSDINVIPEPASLVMLGTGVLGVLGSACRRRKQATA